MYVDAGDSIPPTSTRCRVPAVQGFFGKIPQLREDDFLKTACGLTLLSRWGRGLPLSVEWNSRSSSYGSYLFCYALASPADVYFAFTVLRADEQAVDDRHCDVELLEGFLTVL